jgi:hypothetical protein
MFHRCAHPYGSGLHCLLGALVVLLRPLLVTFVRMNNQHIMLLLSCSVCPGVGLGCCAVQSRLLHLGLHEQTLGP